MKIRVEDSLRGVYDMEVPDDYLTRPPEEKKPTIEERIAALESDNTTLKTQLSAIRMTK